MKTFDGVGSDNTKVEWMKRTPVCYLVYVKRDENGWIVDKLMSMWILLLVVAILLNLTGSDSELTAGVTETTDVTLLRCHHSVHVSPSDIKFTLQQSSL